MSRKVLGPKATREMILRYWDLDWLLAETEREARAIIEHSKEPQAVRDAETVLEWLNVLGVRVDGDNRDAVTLAFKAGALAERMGFRILEPHAKRSLQALRALRAAAKKREHQPEKITEALTLYDRLRQENRGRKKSAVENQVKEETGIRPRTLRYHLKKRSQ